MSHANQAIAKGVPQGPTGTSQVIRPEEGQAHLPQNTPPATPINETLGYDVLHADGAVTERLREFLIQNPQLTEFTIGRSTQNQIITDSRDITISRQHLRVRLGAQDELYVTNVGSQTENTYIQNPNSGSKIELPQNVETQIGSDTKIYIGAAEPFVINPQDRTQHKSRPGYADLNESRLALSDRYLNNRITSELAESGSSLVIGRSPGAHIRPDGSLSKIGSEHARIENIGTGYRVTALAEQGTWASADGGTTYFKLPLNKPVVLAPETSLVLSGIKKCFLPKVSEDSEATRVNTPSAQAGSEKPSSLLSMLADERKILVVGRDFLSKDPKTGAERPKDVVLFGPDYSRFHAELTPTVTGFLGRTPAWEVRNTSTQNPIYYAKQSGGNLKEITPGSKLDLQAGAILYFGSKGAGLMLTKPMSA